MKKPTQVTCSHDKNTIVIFANGEMYFSCKTCAEFVRMKTGKEKREKKSKENG